MEPQRADYSFNPNEKKEAQHKNWLEWSVTVVSGFLVAFTITFLIYQMFHEETSPPDIKVNFGTIVPKDGGYAVPITASNEGAETAQNVLIEVAMELAETEKAEIQFPYLPRKSSVKGWVVFSKKPEPKALKSRIVSYNVP